MTALACVAAAFTAFPITNISPDASQFAALNGSNATLRDRTANDLVGSALRSWFSVPANMVEIKKSDLNLKGTYPNTVVDGSCGHHMEADGNNYDVTLKKDSFLNGSLHVNLTDRSAAVFAEGYLDANLNVKSTVHVSTGAKFFGHGCTRIASTHTTISVGADGKTLLASKLALTKVHVGMANGSLALIGNLNFTIDGKEIAYKPFYANPDHNQEYKRDNTGKLRRGKDMVGMCSPPTADKPMNKVNKQSKRPFSSSLFDDSL